MIAHDSITGNRRKPNRWLRNLRRLMRRHVDAYLGAAVVVMALAVAHTLVALNEERAARLEVEQARDRLARNADTEERRADWLCVPVRGKPDRRQCVIPNGKES